MRVSDENGLGRVTSSIAIERLRVFTRPRPNADIDPRPAHPVYSTEWLAARVQDNADANLRSCDTCGSRGDIGNRRGSCRRARRRWCLPSGSSGSEGVSRYEDDPDVALIERMAGELDPPIVHLGASSELLTPDLVVALRKSLPRSKFMRSVPVTGPEAVGVAQAYDGVVDWILLDSHRTGDVQIGAQGVTHDWSISRKIVESVRTPVILAGGLGPDNVKEAIRSVRPAGVDSKTRTDQDGTHSKDLAKVETFYRAATSG